MVEIIEAEADDLAGPRNRQAIFQSGERAAGGRRRFAGEITERGQIAAGAAQDLAEVGRQRGIRRLQIDDGVALDHAEPQAVLCFKTDNLHKVGSGVANNAGARPPMAGQRMA